MQRRECQGASLVQLIDSMDQRSRRPSVQTQHYESALQHLADKPESYLTQPQEVQDFLSNLPTVWDETRFIAGYPGESAVLARRNGDTGDAAQPWDIYTEGAASLSESLMFNCQPRGGFVMVLK